MTSQVVRGLFSTKLIRDGETVREDTLHNSLTVRGGIEILMRFMNNTSVPDADGGSFTNIRDVSFEAILEDGFVALNREDREAYYDSSNTLILGDNRGWTAQTLGFPTFSGISTGGDLVWTFPTLASGDLPAVRGLATSVPFLLEKPGAATWKGLWLRHAQLAASRKILAVLATALFAEPLVIGASDDVEITYSLQITNVGDTT